MPLAYTSFVPPNGNVAPAIHGANFNAPFTTTATFSGGNCAAGEYRQYVKGTFKVDGSVLDHVLCGQVHMSADVFLEDGCPNGSCTAYGHRSCPQHPYDQFLPQRATGCDFSMSDAPGFSSVTRGKTYSLDLTFQGKLIDTSRGGAVLVTQNWTTTGSQLVAETTASQAPVGLAATDKIVGAHHRKNVESGAAELHILVARPAGLPPLDVSGVTLALFDAAGHSIKPPPAPPSVYEVGSRQRSTVSIVYTLAAGTAPPTVAQLAINKGLVTVNVNAR